MNTGFHGRALHHLVRSALIAGMLAAAGSGCVFYQEEPSPPPETCAGIAVPALSITVLDADTLEPVPATLTITDGAYVAEVGSEALINGAYRAVYERAGRYDIEVRSDGYATEKLDGVAVMDNGCHVVTEEIVVRLVRDELGCPTVFRPGLEITVVDADTGAPLLATVKVTDGSYVEQVPEETTGGTYQAAWERAGVYDIEVSRDGYTSVTIEDVEVTADECNVITKQIDVSLERA